MSNLTLLTDNRTNWLSLIDETDDLDNVNAQLKHFLELCDAEDISSDSDLVSAYNTVDAELNTRGITHTPITPPQPAPTS